MTTQYLYEIDRPSVVIETPESEPGFYHEHQVDCVMCHQHPFHGVVVPVPKGDPAYEWVKQDWHHSFYNEQIVDVWPYALRNGIKVVSDVEAMMQLDIVFPPNRFWQEIHQLAVKLNATVIYLAWSNCD